MLNIADANTVNRLECHNMCNIVQLQCKLKHLKVLYLTFRDLLVLMTPVAVT